jgi:hypothetical protein
MNERHFMRDVASLQRLQDMLDAASFVKGSTNSKAMSEVGSFAGETMDLFSRHFERVYAIDLWDDRAIIGISSPEWPADIERRFDVATSMLPNVNKVKGDSAKSAEGFPDRSLDLIYIDACHEREAALADIKAWMPKVSPGGVISGHDYHPDYLGVIQAVQEIFSGRQNVVEYNWWVRL